MRNETLNSFRGPDRVTIEEKSYFLETTEMMVIGIEMMAGAFSKNVVF